MGRRLSLLAAMALVSAGPAFAADSAWKFDVDARDNPMLTYSESGKEVFFVGCGRAFGLHAKYPGAQDRRRAAVLTIANAKTGMRFRGEVGKPGADEAGPARFTQWDLGYSRQDPNINWQFRIEEKGIVLQAPFDLFRPGGEILWPDIDEVYVKKVTRGRELIIVSRHGKTITVSVVAKFPAQFGPLLQKVVAERAPRVKGIAGIAGRIASAETEDPLSTARYTVRNARGEVLK